MRSKIFLNYPLFKFIVIALIAILSFGMILFTSYLFTKEKLYKENFNVRPMRYSYIPNVARLYNESGFQEIDNYIFPSINESTWISEYFEHDFYLEGKKYKIAVTTIPKTTIYLKFPEKIDLELIHDEKYISVLIDNIYYNKYSIEKHQDKNVLLVQIDDQFKRSFQESYKMALKIKSGVKQIEIIIPFMPNDAFDLVQLEAEYQNNIFLRFVFWVQNIRVEKAFKIINDSKINFIDLVES